MLVQDLDAQGPRGRIDRGKDVFSDFRVYRAFPGQRSGAPTEPATRCCAGRLGKGLGVPGPALVVSRGVVEGNPGNQGQLRRPPIGKDGPVGPHPGRIRSAVPSRQPDPRRRGMPFCARAGRIPFRREPPFSSRARPIIPDFKSTLAACAFGRRVRGRQRHSMVQFPLSLRNLGSSDLARPARSAHNPLARRGAGGGRPRQGVYAISNTCPGKISVEVRAFSRTSSVTVVPKRCAMEKSVSPGWTV